MASNYKRQTRDVWHIEVRYPGPHGWEHELTEDSWREAREQLRTYRRECPEYPVRARKRREKVNG